MIERSGLKRLLVWVGNTSLMLCWCLLSVDSCTWSMGVGHVWGWDLSNCSFELAVPGKHYWQIYVGACYLSVHRASSEWVGWLWWMGMLERSGLERLLVWVGSIWSTLYRCLLSVSSRFPLDRVRWCGRSGMLARSGFEWLLVWVCSTWSVWYWCLLHGGSQISQTYFSICTERVGCKSGYAKVLDVFVYVSKWERPQGFCWTEFHQSASYLTQLSARNFEAIQGMKSLLYPRIYSNISAPVQRTRVACLGLALPWYPSGRHIYWILAISNLGNPDVLVFCTVF